MFQFYKQSSLQCWSIKERERSKFKCSFHLCWHWQHFGFICLHFFYSVFLIKYLVLFYLIFISLFIHFLFYTLPAWIISLLISIINDLQQTTFRVIVFWSLSSISCFSFHNLTKQLVLIYHIFENLSVKKEFCKNFIK